MMHLFLFLAYRIVGYVPKKNVLKPNTRFKTTHPAEYNDINRTFKEIHENVNKSLSSQNFLNT